MRLSLNMNINEHPLKMAGKNGFPSDCKKSSHKNQLTKQNHLPQPKGIEYSFGFSLAAHHFVALIISSRPVVFVQRIDGFIIQTGI